MAGFGNVNKNLEKYVKDLISIDKFDLEEFGKLMRKIYIYADKICETGNDYSPYFQTNTTPVLPNKYFTKEDTLKYVVEFLHEIDPFMVNKFEEAVANEIIHLTDKKTLNELEENEGNYYYFHNIAGVVNDNYFTNIVINNTIADAFTIVHEFMHYCNLSKIDKMSYAWTLFTEGYSHFFETLFLQFCMEKEELKEESICYFHGLLYSVMNRSYEFITQFLVLDVFLCHGNINNKSIYKYCRDFVDPKYLFYSILNMVDEIDEYFKTKDSRLDVYLDDAKYVLGVPFAQELLENYPKKKKEILEDYYLLNEVNINYYFEKYELDQYDTYEKVFCLKKVK